MRTYFTIIIITILSGYSVYSQNFIRATKINDGQKITLSNDAVLEIKLPCNPSTGCGWYPVLNQKSKVKSQKSEIKCQKSNDESQKFTDGIINQIGDWEYIPEQNDGIPGQEGTEIIRFTGVSEGTSDLMIEYKRPWEKEKSSVDNFKLTIISKGKYTGNFVKSQTSKDKNQKFTELNGEDTELHSGKVKSQKTNTLSSPGLKSLKSASPLPSSFSWQAQCTAVKNQGECGCCWAFASTSCYEAIINIMDGNIRCLSEQWLINCASPPSGYGGCLGEWCPNYLWVSPGAVYESELAYADISCSSGTGIGTCGTYTYYEKADNSENVNGWTPTDEEIKQAIYNYGPVWAELDVGSKFESYTGGIFINNDGSNANHAIALVGWKDTTLSNGSSGYWILKNSWGIEWGEQGYMRIGYGVNVVGTNANYIVYEGGIPCSGKPDPGNTISSANQVCSTDEFILSLQNEITPSGGVTYQWESSPDDSTWSEINGATGQQTDISNQISETWYRCEVNCSGKTGISTPLQVTNNTLCYCLGAYNDCGSIYGIDITNITFGDINNTTDGNCNLPNNYTDYTGLSTIAAQGLSYPISVSSNYGTNSIYWGIWTDWNNSGSFTDNKDKYIVINNDKGASLTGSGTINVPEWATTGNHRMRIRANYNSDPGQTNACANLSYGEQEDYTVIIQPLRFSVSGIVSYDNTSNSPLDSTIVYIENTDGVKLDSTITDNTGAYDFENVINGTYSIVCGNTRMKWGGSNPVDALIVNRFYVGLIDVFGDAMENTAANVSDGIKINPIDALMIDRRYVNLITKFNIPDWIFESTTVTVNDSAVVQNIKAICAGDVNGTYVPRN